MDRIACVAVDAAVAELADSLQAGAVADADSDDAAAVADRHVVADSTDLRGMFISVVAGDFFEPVVKGRAVPVHGHNIGRVGAELVGDGDFPAAGLVED